jgi:hypothetical protein
VLRDARQPVSAKDIQTNAGLTNRNAPDSLLFKTLRDGETERAGRGLLAMPGKIGNKDMTVNHLKIRHKQTIFPPVTVVTAMSSTGVGTRTLGDALKKFTSDSNLWTAPCEGPQRR